MKISGYAATWGAVLHLDRKNPLVFQAGCFRTAIEQHKRGGTAPKMLLNHFDHKEIGVWDSLVEDEIGLWVEGRLTPTSAAKTLVERGRMPDGLCLNAFVLDQSQCHRAGKVWVVTEGVVLSEISITETPCNPLARVTYLNPPGGTDFVNGAG